MEDADDPDLLEIDEFDHLEASKAFIREYLEANERFTYIYAVDDEWCHRVDVEKILPEQEADHPVVLKYRGDCPPEDPEGEARPYDMQKVNEELKEKFFYRWGRAEKRMQSTLYKNMRDGDYGLRATKKDQNKEGMIISPDDQLQESMDRMEEWLLQTAYREQKLSGATLKEIFEDYPMDVLQMITEEKGVPELAELPRDELEDRLIEHMLQPEVIAEYIACLTDTEICAFERWMASKKWGDGFLGAEKLLEAGYLGLLEEGSITMPKDVLEAYHTFSDQIMLTKPFQKDQQERSYLLCCLKTCGLLYGVTPIRILMKMLETNRLIHMTEQDVRRQTAALPYELFQGDFAGDSFYSSNVYQDSAQLLRMQGKKEFYIPTKEEIFSVGTTGSLPEAEGAEPLRRYLIDQMDVFHKTVDRILPLIQNLICCGGGMQDVFLLIDQEGVRIRTEQQREDLTGLLEVLWNNTRMRENRGFTPNEMEQKRNRRPELKAAGAAERDNIINFEEAKRKK